MAKAKVGGKRVASRLNFRIKILDTALDSYVKLLQSDSPFAFVRYGNGEWDGILGTRKETGSRSQNLAIPSLQKELQDSLRHAYDPSSYFLGMQYYMQHRPQLWSQTLRWLWINGPNLVWHNGDVFHWASSGGKLWPLIRELRKKSLVFIGPPHLRSISRLLPYVGFIQVRLPNCYQDKAQIRKAILNHLGSAVFCFSAGPTAKVLIHDLFPLLGQDNFLIDFGSLWDVYCGVKSRTYHKSMTLATMRKNFGGQQ